jgi:hypothetical protein
MKKNSSRARAAAPAPVTEKKAPEVEKRPWSPLSQAHIQALFVLQDSLAATEKLILIRKGRLKISEQNRDRQLRLVNGGQNIYGRNLDDSLREAEDHKRVISALEEQVESLKCQIAAMEPTPEQAAKRAATQAEIARLAKECDARIGGVDEARRELETRVQGVLAIKEKIAVLAKEIDLQNSDEFSSAPFQSLLVSLPGPLRPASQRWLAWFFGADETCVARIRHDIGTFPETLRSAHCYRRDQEARLNPTDYQRATWEPPRVPTAFELDEQVRGDAERIRRESTFSVSDVGMFIAGMTP